MADNETPQSTMNEDQNISVRVQIDESDARTDYANGFRSNVTPEEVVVDFGLNLLTPTTSEQQASNERQVRFKVNQRVVMNFYTAKRLALALGQLVRRHEEQFGELQLSANDRRVDQS